MPWRGVGVPHSLSPSFIVLMLRLFWRLLHGLVSVLAYRPAGVDREREACSGVAAAAHHFFVGKFFSSVFFFPWKSVPHPPAQQTLLTEPLFRQERSIFCFDKFLYRPCTRLSPADPPPPFRRPSFPAVLLLLSFNSPRLLRPLLPPRHPRHPRHPRLHPHRLRPW